VDVRKHNIYGVPCKDYATLTLIWPWP